MFSIRGLEVKVRAPDFTSFPRLCSHDFCIVVALCECETCFLVCPRGMSCTFGAVAVSPQTIAAKFVQLIDTAETQEVVLISQ